jgi:N-acetylmuramoyl-L-alanine amidase
MKIVVLSAGHSNTDPGAVYEGLKEADLNKQIVRVASDILRGQGIGVLNPPDDLDLVGTINWINRNGSNSNIAVEVHINAGGGTGVEGWYYNKSSVSKRLSDTILAGIVASTGMANRGSKDESTNKWGRLGFVHDTAPLACLIECGFIDSKQDRELLNSMTGLYKIGFGLAQGIIKYLGLTYVAPTPEKDTTAEAVSTVRQRLANVQSECQRLKDSLDELLTILKL